MECPRFGRPFRVSGNVGAVQSNEGVGVEMEPSAYKPRQGVLDRLLGREEVMQEALDTQTQRAEPGAVKAPEPKQMKYDFGL